jgi:tRNA A37 N6-isopentenylltransferase MiaA
MIDMSSLLEEMDSMPSYDKPISVSSSKSNKPRSSGKLSNPTLSSKLKERDEAAMKALDEHNASKLIRITKKRKQKPRILHSKTHGSAPVNLMTQFLSLVSSNKMLEGKLS